MSDSGLRLAIDAVGMRHQSGGAVVLADLVDALLTFAAPERLTVFASSRELGAVVPTSDGRVELREPLADTASRIELLRWVTSGLDRACRDRQVDGLITLNSLGWSTTPTVVLFQQQLMFAPEAVRAMPPAFRLRLKALRVMARRVCRRARLVVAQAPHVARSLVDHFGVDAHRVETVMPVVRWPLESAASRTAAMNLDAPTLLYVGTDRPYKSLSTVLSAFRGLRARHPSIELAITLPENHAASQLAGVRCLGTLPRASVKRALEQARVLIMPSLAETLGLPLLEALDVGCPIIAADLPYARDVCADSALYFEPRDVSSCIHACESLLSDEALAGRLKRAAQARMATLRGAEPARRLAAAIVQAVRS